MNKFESILLKYGQYVFCMVFLYAKSNELYEDCAQIKDVMDKYKVSENTSLEDWQCELWRLGHSGDTAMNNLPRYFNEAKQKLGYL